MKKTHKQLLFGDKIRKTLHESKDNSVLAKPLAACRPTYLSSVVSELYHTMLKSMCMSKNRYFYHIFVSPGTPLGQMAITLNVVWMEREFDAYKLSR